MMMSQRKLVEEKDWEYRLYEYEGKLELIIPIPSPAPGFDVKHILSDGEKQEYEAHGMSSLRQKMVDMEKNYLNYTHQSWR